MAIAIPMLLLILFGYALTLDVDNVPLVVWDQSGTPASREFVSRFAGSRYFALAGMVDNYRTIERAIDARRALVALVIPPTSPSDLDAGRDASRCSCSSTAATRTRPPSPSATPTSSSPVYSPRHAARSSSSAAAARRCDPPLDVRPRVWFNADLESRNYIIPGLIAVIMMVIAALLTSLTVAREWERGTMEQLISTPVKGPELILGKLIPYFAIGMFDVLLAVLMGEFLFHVPLRGNVAAAVRHWR